MIDEFFDKNHILKNCKESVMMTINILFTCFYKDSKLLICGNGGSAADAQHIVGELMKSFHIKRLLPIDLQNRIRATYPKTHQYFFENLQWAFPAMSLNGETALISAIYNDIKPDLVYAQQLIGYGKNGDVLLAISTSGNSKNIIYAAQIAKVLDMTVIGLTGKTGGQLKDYCDITIKVPFEKTFEIQEYHLPIYHAICLAIENEFFG